LAVVIDFGSFHVLSIRARSRFILLSFHRFGPISVRGVFAVSIAAGLICIGTRVIVRVAS